jgi:hypothetical protein
MTPSGPSEPILNTLKDEMRCGIFTNAKGEILIVHDHELSGYLGWVEYDEADSRLYLVRETGSIQPLGLDIDKAVQKNLRKANTITLAHLSNQTIISTQQVVLIFRKT